MVPDSFDGYIKEFRLFSKFHSIEQMKIDRLRTYMPNSYDDEFLISYWKLSELYNSSSIQYTVKDTSMYS